MKPGLACPLRGEGNRRPILSLFPGFLIFPLLPRACALGCILTPRCGLVWSLLTRSAPARELLMLMLKRVQDVVAPARHQRSKPDARRKPCNAARTISR